MGYTDEKNTMEHAEDYDLATFPVQLTCQKTDLNNQTHIMISSENRTMEGTCQTEFTLNDLQKAYPCKQLILLSIINLTHFVMDYIC